MDIPYAAPRPRTALLVVLVLVALYFVLQPKNAQMSAQSQAAAPSSQETDTLIIELMNPPPIAGRVEVVVYVGNTSARRIIADPADDNNRFFAAEVPRGLPLALHISLVLEGRDGGEPERICYCGQIGYFADSNYTKTGKIRQQFIGYKNVDATTYEVHVSGDDSEDETDVRCYFPEVSI